MLQRFITHQQAVGCTAFLTISNDVFQHFDEINKLYLYKIHWILFRTTKQSTESKVPRRWKWRGHAIDRWCIKRRKWIKGIGQLMTLFHHKFACISLCCNIPIYKWHYLISSKAYVMNSLARKTHGFSLLWSFWWVSEHALSYRKSRSQPNSCFVMPLCE